MAYDFINDTKLKDALPLALREKMQNIQESRIAAGLTADNGMVFATAERRDMSNAQSDTK